MATISFSNGQNVEFNGTPTQQDVEEIATKLGIHSPTPSATPTMSAGQKAQQVYQQAGDTINQQLQGQGQFAGQGAIQRGVGATETAFNAIPNVIGSQLPQVTQTGLSKLGLNISSGVNWLTDKISNIKPLQNFMSDVPKNNAGEQILGTLGSAGNIAGNILAADQGAKGLQKTADFAKTNIPKAADAIGSKISDIKMANQASKLAQDTSKVQEMVSPKPTLKEVRLAQAEGRLVKGEPRTFFKAGTPDTITPSPKVQSATQTILKNIPEAPKMSPPELYNAVEQHITKTAEALRPEMEKTPIKPETIQKINDDWASVKKQQLAEAPATEEVNVAKRQAKFEETLKKSGSTHQGDLWDTRIAYDKSVPRNVKMANSMSPESLQLQKAEWLQNREILNNAINDTKNGMGAKSQKAFSDMTDLYEAKTNIQSRAKLETKGQPSKFKEIYDSKTGRIIRGAVKVGVGAELVKRELGL